MVFIILQNDGFVKADTALNRVTNENYVVYHLNFSPENKNLDYLKSLGFPQRFGFPVFVVLDAAGNRLHTQDSGLLEKEKSYDKSRSCWAVQKKKSINILYIYKIMKIS